MNSTIVRAASTRALRTLIQVLLAVLGTGAITDLNYVEAASVAGGAALLSFLQGVLNGLPEVADVGVLEVVEPDPAPARTASVAVWRAYRAKQGFDVTGLTKAQLIDWPSAP